ncbi:ethylene-responsive transcription factor 5 [Artemisia annua]|uniref:Ethylene-responsive transcription factor 5 n=1 Tax=Artemisia annua TaxID=35608 RepID=A0A2U1PAY3_ARTAN|nr:ethylene-responsive transcription factor 5 [Artemisia annua]
MALEMPVSKSTGRKRAGKVVDVEERENKKVMKTELKTDVNADVTGPLTPSSWMAVWDCGEGDGIFEVPPLSPYPCMVFPVQPVELTGFDSWFNRQVRSGF